MPAALEAEHPDGIRPRAGPDDRRTPVTDIHGTREFPAQFRPRKGMQITLIEIPGVVIAPPLFLQDRPAPQQVIRVDGTSLRVAEFRETLKRLKLPVQFQQRRAEPRALLGKGGVITDRPFDAMP